MPARGPWIDHFGDNFLWSNATLILKGMAPYGVVSLEEMDRACEKLRARQGETDKGKAWFEEWRALGDQIEQRGDDALANDLLALLAEYGTDYTIFFRALSTFDLSGNNATLRDLMVNREAFDRWTVRYAARLNAENSFAAERRLRMNRVNPKYVLRNYMAQLAIDGLVQDDPSVSSVSAAVGGGGLIGGIGAYLKAVRPATR
mgnify:CR=1 FL=1